MCQPESRIPPSRIQEYPSTLVDLKSGTLTRSCGQSLGNLTRAIPLSVTQNQKRYLWWKPMAWLGIIRPTNQSEKWHMQQWCTFFCLTLGLPMPWISAGTRCACQQFDQFANHALTCNTHGGAAKSHDWAVAQVASVPLGLPLWASLSALYLLVGARCSHCALRRSSAPARRRRHGCRRGRQACPRRRAPCPASRTRTTGHRAPPSAAHAEQHHTRPGAPVSDFSFSFHSPNQNSTRRAKTESGQSEKFGECRWTSRPSFGSPSP